MPTAGTPNSRHRQSSGRILVGVAQSAMPPPASPFKTIQPTRRRAPLSSVQQESAGGVKDATQASAFRSPTGKCARNSTAAYRSSASGLENAVRPDTAATAAPSFIEPVLSLVIVGAGGAMRVATTPTKGVPRPRVSRGGTRESTSSDNTSDGGRASGGASYSHGGGGGVLEQVVAANLDSTDIRRRSGGQSLALAEAASIAGSRAGRRVTIARESSDAGDTTTSSYFALPFGVAGSGLGVTARRVSTTRNSVRAGTGRESSGGADANASGKEWPSVSISTVVSSNDRADARRVSTRSTSSGGGSGCSSREGSLSGDRNFSTVTTRDKSVSSSDSASRPSSSSTGSEVENGESMPAVSCSSAHGREYSRRSSTWSNDSSNSTRSSSSISSRKLGDKDAGCKIAEMKPSSVSGISADGRAARRVSTWSSTSGESGCGGGSSTSGGGCERVVRSLSASRGLVGVCEGCREKRSEEGGGGRGDVFCDDCAADAAEMSAAAEVKGPTRAKRSTFVSVHRKTLTG